MKFEQLGWVKTKWPKGEIARFYVNGRPASVVTNENTQYGGYEDYQINYTNKHGSRVQLRRTIVGVKSFFRDFDCSALAGEAA